MIIFIRGHIRNSFNNPDLVELIKHIKGFHKTPLKIYIHTWNIYSSDISWRNINQDLRTVTKKKILKYFGGLQKFIKNIIIDDDTKNNIIGNIDGTICSSKCPVIAWKNMWYGIYNGIKYIKENNDIHDEYIINMRFDILNNSFSKLNEDILKFVHAQRNKTMFDKNIFMNNKIVKINQIRGIDNFYIGNINTMYILIDHFNSNLDEIVLKYPNNTCQESLVYLENLHLFRNKTIREIETV